MTKKKVNWTVPLMQTLVLIQVHEKIIKSLFNQNNVVYLKPCSHVLDY